VAEPEICHRCEVRVAMYDVRIMEISRKLCSECFVEEEAAIREPVCLEEEG